MGGNDRRRIARLIDGLIDQAHQESPWQTFRLRLPSGEALHIPPHDPLARCHAPGHLGYFVTLVQPFLTAPPVPLRRRPSDLRCWLVPIVPAPTGPAEWSGTGSATDDDQRRTGSDHPAPYSVDLAPPPGGRRLPGSLWLRPSDPLG